MRFFADEMLGKLARWLRMGGLDVLYERKVEDDDLIEKSRREKRVILTRDTRLIKRLKEEEFLFISENYLEDQIKEFFNRFPNMRKKQKPLTRCAECNTVLKTIEKELVVEKVWPYVYETQEHFTTCPTCRRIYWRATHVEKIVKRLNRLWDLGKTP